MPLVFRKRPSSVGASDHTLDTDPKITASDPLTEEQQIPVLMNDQNQADPSFSFNQQNIRVKPSDLNLNSPIAPHLAVNTKEKTTPSPLLDQTSLRQELGDYIERVVSDELAQAHQRIKIRLMAQLPEIIEKNRKNQ